MKAKKIEIDVPLSNKYISVKKLLKIIKKYNGKKAYLKLTTDNDYSDCPHLVLVFFLSEMEYK